MVVAVQNGKGGGAFWVKAISSIYGRGGGLEGLGRRAERRGMVWSNILRAGELIDGVGIEFSTSFGKVVNNGLDTLFWKEKWVEGGEVLRDKCERLFQLERNKEVKVGERGVWADDGWRWQWDWVREPRGRNLDDLEVLESCVRGYTIKRDGADKWKWVLGKEGVLSVRELRRLVNGKVLAENRRREEMLWCRVVPKKVCLLVWRLRNGRVPVREVLDNIGIDVPCILCPCCGEEIETINHCFIGCKHVKEVWGKLFAWWGLGQCNLSNMNEIITHEGSTGFSSQKKLTWKAVIWSALYLIWNYRNNKVFKANTEVVPDLFQEIQMRTYGWVIARDKNLMVPWDEWKK